MAKPNTYKWDGGGLYLSGKCDIPGCENSPNWRYWFSPTYMNGDDECLGSLCNCHKEYKKFNTTEKIVEAYNKNNAKQFECDECQDTGEFDEEIEKGNIIKKKCLCQIDE